MNTPHTQDFEKKLDEILRLHPIGKIGGGYGYGTPYEYTPETLKASILSAHTEALQVAKDEAFKRGIRLTCGLVRPFLSERDFEEIIASIDNADVDKIIKQFEGA